MAVTWHVSSEVRKPPVKQILLLSTVLQAGRRDILVQLLFCLLNSPFSTVIGEEEPLWGAVVERLWTCCDWGGGGGGGLRLVNRVTGIGVGSVPLSVKLTLDIIQVVCQA